MVLKKIARTLRREGLPGLFVRLRHRQRPGGSAALTPPQQPPFRLVGTGTVREALAAALQRLLGPDALTDAEGAAAIHVAPDPEGPDFRPIDAVLFCSDAAMLQFLADGPARGLRACGAVLLPSADGLPALHAAGIPRGRIFVLPALADLATGADPRQADDLAGGLARWLIAAGGLAPGGADPALFPALRDLAPGARLCLGLPESPERRAAFLRRGLQDFPIFDGIRRQPGWQGCGWSYATMARAALQQGAVPLTICEDDLQPQPGFQTHLAMVRDHLARQEWDVFSGMVTDLPESCRIHHVEQRGRLTFVHLDYTTGMVFNSYNRRALERLAAWTPGDGQPETDTIDAWLSRLPGLRVITTLPFLAGHDINATSTIFGFANRRYDGMIRASERRLARMVAQWLRNR